MLLALDTASDTCAVALHDGHAVLADAALHRPRAHAAHLAPIVRDVLAHAGVSPLDLTAVAVAAGPGSFTGLRIGLSTAKGLAWAAGAALVAVPTLEALASTALDGAAEGDVVAAALPSRRGEVFCAAFRVGPGGGLVALSEAASVSVVALSAWLPEGGRVWLVGPAAPALLAGAGERAGVHVGGRTPSAVPVATLGAARLAAGRVEDVATFEPRYVNAFVATVPRAIFEAPGG